MSRKHMEIKETESEEKDWISFSAWLGNNGKSFSADLWKGGVFLTLDGGIDQKNSDSLLL